jgi:hypothetical protein
MKYREFLECQGNCFLDGNLINESGYVILWSNGWQNCQSHLLVTRETTPRRMELHCHLVLAFRKPGGIPEVNEV